MERQLDSGYSYVPGFKETKRNTEGSLGGVCTRFVAGAQGNQKERSFGILGGGSPSKETHRLRGCLACPLFSEPVPRVHPREVERKGYGSSIPRGSFTWVLVKIKPPGTGPQVLGFGSIFQGKPFWGTHFCPTAIVWNL